MKLHIISIITFLFVPIISFGQTNEMYSTREINLDYKDSTIVLRILNQKINLELNNSLEYYWYMAENINTNIGGYSGYLLHGECLVFARGKKLLERKEFFEGLKHGIWKKWNSNGKILRTESWNKGVKEGAFIVYHEKGKILKKLNYKNGLLHGKCTFFQDTAIINKNYKNGKEILPKIKKKKIKKTHAIDKDKEKSLEKSKEKEVPQKEKKPLLLKKRKIKTKKPESVDIEKKDKTSQETLKEVKSDKND